ncbi:YbhB/YbcL family Raf kinase inhibitor-like protein [Novipirellula herctigrandis]|uniref:YbhB/YbcL family Raf kinase inhibitor-like protein n=1 Tax=Novipirellula herctigrandis TaxID=2527986 RepID=UPI003AF35399
MLEFLKETAAELAKDHVFVLEIQKSWRHLPRDQIQQKPKMSNLIRGFPLLVTSLLFSENFSGQRQDAPTKYKEMIVMQITSTAFTNGKPIPAKYTGVGEDISPPLSWTKVPNETESFALICDDPDVPSRANPRPQGPWIHWVIYNIPADESQLPAGIACKPEPADPAGAHQGTNDFARDNVGYRGPMPPKASGPHRYFFTLYSLDQQIDLPAKRADQKSLLAAMQGHILAQAKLMGTFEQK